MAEAKQEKAADRPRYWVCIIGPVPDNRIKSNGGDSPPRMAARQAILDSTGCDPLCNSGWCEEEEYERIMAAKYPSTVSEQPTEVPEITNSRGTPEGGLRDSYGDYVHWNPGDPCVILNGGFTAEELEGFAAWIRQHQK